MNFGRFWFHQSGPAFLQVASRIDCTVSRSIDMEHWRNGWFELVVKIVGSTLSTEKTNSGSVLPLYFSPIDICRCILQAQNVGITPKSVFLPQESLICSQYLEDAPTWSNEIVQVKNPFLIFYLLSHYSQKNVSRCVEVIRQLHAMDCSNYSPFVFDVFQASPSKQFYLRPSFLGGRSLRRVCAPPRKPAASRPP